MADHPIQGLMLTAMESLKEMVDVNTVIGDPVETQDGSVIIPISRVAFGFAAGGGEYAGTSREGMGSARDRGDGDGQAQGFPFGGGSGAGVSVQPVGFLVVGQGNVRLLGVEAGMVDKLIDVAPQMIERMSGMLGRGGRSRRDEDEVEHQPGRR